VREAAIDTLPPTAENQALAEKIRPAVKKYQNIGIRIEDSFLVEESGLRQLSASVPRTIEEIEAYMKPRSSK
jgi:Xaa-Pro aminopeptidase